jgi:hypothetical protein
MFGEQCRSIRWITLGCTPRSANQSMPDETPADTTQIKQTPVKAINPSGEEIEITEIVATQPLVVPVEAPASSLPRTGSSLPLLEAAGLLALAAAVVLRVAAQKIV